VFQVTEILDPVDGPLMIPSPTSQLKARLLISLADVTCNVAGVPAQRDGGMVRFRETPTLNDNAGEEGVTQYPFDAVTLIDPVPLYGNV